MPIMTPPGGDEEAPFAAAGGAVDDAPQDQSEPHSPEPLSSPSLDPMTPPAVPQYTRLELRQLEPDGDPTHCWTQIAADMFSVRAASYLKVQSPQVLHAYAWTNSMHIDHACVDTPHTHTRTALARTRGKWSTPHTWLATSLLVQDGKKASSAHGSDLLAVELFRSTSPVFHVAARPDSPVPSLSQRTASALESVFIVNLLFPAADGFYQLVLYFGIVEETGAPSAAARLLERFRNAPSDAFRNKRLKIVPSVVEGPWLVQQAVGTRAAILGKTLRQRFYRGDGYMEVDVDCNSSPAAGRVVSLVKSYARSLVVDLAFVIEAQTADELPERVLGCGRIMHVTLDDRAVPTYPYEIEEEEEEEVV